MEKNKKIVLMTLVIIIVLIGVFFALRDNKTSDQEAYKDILATMSMKKAKQFFIEYPNSNLKNILIDEIIRWCKKEKTDECYRIILDTIPKDHLKYKELYSYYKKHYQIGAQKQHDEN
jgi:hypothetical protein